MNFIEIFFLIIYIRFLISWPKQTVAWTLIAFWEIIALGLVIWGIVWASEVSSNSNNLWVLTPTVIGILMTYIFYKLLRNIFGDSTNYVSTSKIKDSPEEIFDVLVDSMQGNTHPNPNNTDAFVDSIFKSEVEDSPKPVKVAAKAHKLK